MMSTPPPGAVPRPKVTLRRAVAADFPEVYRSLLAEFHNPYLKEADYRRLFETNQEDWHGFVLEHEGGLVGFASLLFSTRTIRGKQHRFANFNHWVVKEEFRNAHALSLLFAAMKLKDVTLTAYTPVAKVVPIYRSLRWQELDRYTNIIPILPDPRALFRKSNLILSLAGIENRLTAIEVILFRDHQYPHCHHAYVEDSGGGCYLIYTRVFRKGLPFVAIHYIGDAQVFLRTLPVLRLRLCLREKATALLVDERFLGGQKPFASHRYKEPRFFRSSELTHSDIDGLYSEYTIVNI